MRTSLVTLGAGCLAFGAFATQFVSRVAGPAASSLLHPNVYARADLSTASVSVPRLAVDFNYFDPKTLLITAGELLGGAVLLALVLRSRTMPRPLRWLRAVHTGSVNDYAAFAAAGLVISAYVLLA